MSESSDDEDTDDNANLHYRSLAWPAPVNRLRCMHQQPGIVAVIDESSRAAVVNISMHLTSLAEEDQPRPPRKNNVLQVISLSYPTNLH
jgi:hypothetical protein